MIVKGYEKSIILGGVHRLFPLTVENIPALVETLKAALKEAEKEAYRRGVEDTQEQMQKAIGIKR